jgi:hypothetical protein
MLSLAPYEDDAFNISLHSCPLHVVWCSLCPVLRQEEAILEVRYLHAIRNFDHVYHAFIVFNAEFEGPMSLD